MKEETNLVVEIESILSVVSNYLSLGLHTLVVVLQANVTGGNPAPGDDIVELKWFSMSGELPGMAFEADAHIIERMSKMNLIGVPADPAYSNGP